MKKLTSIIASNKKHRNSDSLTLETFTELAHNELKKSKDYVEESADMIVSEALTESRGDFESALQAVQSFVRNIEPTGNLEEGDKGINADELAEFVNVLSYIEFFKSLHFAWLNVNGSDTWYSNHIKDSIDKILDYVNQLASYVSIDSENIRTQISVDDSELRNKAFSTVVKRQIQWKLVRQYLRRTDIEVASEHQTATVKALILSIHNSIEKFVEITSSK